SSNVEDLARYVSLQFRDEKRGDGQILRGSTLREMHRAHWLDTSWESGRGLGFSVRRQDERVVVGHGGWVAGNTTQISFVPDDKIGVIVLTNCDDGHPALFARRILKLMIPVLKKAAAPEVAPQRADSSWARYVGTYTDPSWFETEVMILDNRLVMKDFAYPPEDDPRSDMIELSPEGERTFRMTGENGNGELVVFEMEADEVVRVKVGENYMYPKK
ncbi:MAG: serine hydrolase, partial [Candidatus Eisenbacteria bacterium]